MHTVFIVILGIQQAVLTSNTSTVVNLICPSTVQFTCIGEDIPTLRWFIDGTEVVRYIHAPGDENRLPFNVEYGGDLGPVQIISVQASLTSDGTNVTSTFTTNTSVLEDFSNIQCGSIEFKSDLVMVNISVLGKYPVMKLEF
jgi:hypothetical protein